jgi:hypothetical protein
MGAFYPTPQFTGDASEAARVTETFPDADAGTSLRTLDDGVIEAGHPDSGGSLWYSSAYYREPDAPHDIVQDSNGVSWYAMQPHASVPEFDSGSATDYAGIGDIPHGASGADYDAGNGGSDESAADYNRALFRNFMPGYETQVSRLDASRDAEGMIEVRHADGSGTAFYDKTMYQSPRGDYKVYEDNRGGQWYAIHGTPSVERRPVYEDGKPVYDGDNLKTVNVESVKYKSALTRFENPKKRDVNDRKPPNPKRKQ